MEQDLKIFLDEVTNLFFKYGVKSVTMADIARELGISKKTIYTKVTDKNDLVEKVMEYRLTCDQQMVQQIATADKNAIDEQFDICSAFGQIIKNMHPSVMFDLKKYYPEIWKKFKCHKENFALQMLIKNLKKGKEQGVFRKGFNEEVIARLYFAQIDAIMDSTVFDPKEFNYLELVLEMMIYHISGVSSPEGTIYLEKTLKDKNLTL